MSVIENDIYKRHHKPLIAPIIIVSYGWYLKCSGADLVSIETRDGEHRFLIVCHRHEAETFAFAGRQITHHLRTLYAHSRL